MLTPYLYRTRIDHLRKAPTRNAFSHRSYAWYIDIDELPWLPIWLRPFAVFRAGDHLSAPESGPDTLRTRVDAFLAGHGINLGGGRVTALLQARVLGHVFNPISVFWCNDAEGHLRYVIVEVHNTYGGRHAYLLPPTQDGPVAVPKQFYVSPFNEVDGYYLVHAPEPGRTAELAVSWHRDNKLVFVATLRGERRPASPAEVAAMQVKAPLAPLLGAIAIRWHGISLWRRGLPVIPRSEPAATGKAARR